MRRCKLQLEWNRCLHVSMHLCSTEAYRHTAAPPGRPQTFLECSPLLSRHLGLKLLLRPCRPAISDFPTADRSGQSVGGGRLGRRAQSAPGVLHLTHITVGRLKGHDIYSLSACLYIDESQVHRRQEDCPTAERLRPNSDVTVVKSISHIYVFFLLIVWSEEGTT